METSLFFEILVKKIDVRNDRGIEYIEKIWEWYRDLLRFVATKYVPTLKFSLDVPELYKVPNKVAVYIKDQGHGVNYYLLLTQLLQILLIRIRFAETDTTGQSLTEQLSCLLQNYHGLSVAPMDCEEINRISKQIDRLVTEYRSAHRVSIRVEGDQAQSNPIPLSPQPQLLLPIDNNPDEGDLDDPDGKGNKGFGGNVTMVPPFNPVELKIDGLDQGYKGYLTHLAVIAKLPSFFAVGNKIIKLELQEEVRLQVLDNLKSYLKRELTLVKSNASLNTYVIIDSED